MNRWELWLIRVLRPFLRTRHVAFIMDGNRRYAKLKGLATQQGHRQGLENLCELVKISKELGISIVTVFGFALQNFNRTGQEIDDLLMICSESLKESGSLRSIAKTLECRIRFHGDFSFIGDDILSLIRQLEKDTECYSTMTINVCMSYGARNEIARALDESLDEVSLERRVARFKSCIVESPNVLIRTSNVTRLSDFLIYQVSEHTSIYFVKELWPELDPWRLVTILAHHALFC